MPPEPINNYWTRLNKISWFVSGEQINYLPSWRLRQIIDVRDTGKSRHFVITEFNNCFIIRSPSLFFLMNVFGKRSDLPFFTQERYHAWFRLRMSRILFAAKHSWTTLRMSRPLFVGSYLQVTWWAFSQWKGRKICIEMIISFIVLQFSQIILYYSLLNLPRWLNTVTGDETGLTSQLGSIVRTLFSYKQIVTEQWTIPFVHHNSLWTICSTTKP